jgi:hypothetical protein
MHELPRKNSAREDIMAARSSKGPVGKRTTVRSNGASRYVRRDTSGQFTGDQVKAGRSVSRDKLTNAKHTAPKGMKDRGD